MVSALKVVWRLRMPAVVTVLVHWEDENGQPASATWQHAEDIYEDAPEAIHDFITATGRLHPHERVGEGV